MFLSLLPAVTTIAFCLLHFLLSIVRILTGIQADRILSHIHGPVPVREADHFMIYAFLQAEDEVCLRLISAGI